MNYDRRPPEAWMMGYWIAVMAFMMGCSGSSSPAGGAAGGSPLGGSSNPSTGGAPGSGVTVTNNITGTSAPNPCTNKWVSF